MMPFVSDGTRSIPQQTLTPLGGKVTHFFSFLQTIRKFFSNFMVFLSFCQQQELFFAQ